MHNTLKTAAIMLALAAPASHAEELAPDALVKTISMDVLAAIRQDKDIQAGNPNKIASLVEAKILPHFDFAHTTRIAMGANWRRASPEQRERLVREFRTLLVRMYSSALANYRDQVIEFKPLRAQAGEAQVIVRSEVRQSGTSGFHRLRDGENRLGMEGVRRQDQRREPRGHLPRHLRRGSP